MIPKPKVIERMAKEIVFEAEKNGTLIDLSPKDVRIELEHRLSLKDRTLKSQKDVIKRGIDSALEEIREAEEEDEEEEEEPEEPQYNKEEEDKKGKKKVETTKAPKAKQPPPDIVLKSKKRKSNAKEEIIIEEESKVEQSLPPKTKEKAAETMTPKAKQPSPEVVSQSRKRKSEVDDDDDSISSKKKPRASTTKSKERKKAFTSAEFVPPSSDIEDGLPAKPTKPSLSSADETTPQKSSSKTRSSPQRSNPASTSESKGKEQAEKSDSELSVLIDEPPKARKKGKGTQSTEVKEAKGKKKGASNATLNKDEETIKKLKSFVNACGVRKPWSRLFAEIKDSPSQQIALLRKILADLGMTGRLSMEQARGIKEKRELAKELAEVQSFEQETNKIYARKRSRSTATKDESEPYSEEEEDEDEDLPSAKPAKRKVTARQTISAFLEDQSDSE